MVTLLFLHARKIVWRNNRKRCFTFICICILCVLFYLIAETDRQYQSYRGKYILPQASWAIKTWWQKQIELSRHFQSKNKTSVYLGQAQHENWFVHPCTAMQNLHLFSIVICCKTGERPFQYIPQVALGAHRWLKSTWEVHLLLTSLTTGISDASVCAPLCLGHIWGKKCIWKCQHN